MGIGITIQLCICIATRYYKGSSIQCLSNDLTSFPAEVENLPPIPQPPRITFKPRTPARIHPSPAGLQSIPAPRSRTVSSPASLPQQLVRLQLNSRVIGRIPFKHIGITNVRMLINFFIQGLPPLTKLPGQETTPSRVDRRSVLPPVKGGLVSLQARKALSQGQVGEGGGRLSTVTMPDRPARLPPIGSGAGLFGPTNMPDRPLHLPPIQQPEAGKGKAPIGGKLFPKKGTPQSSQEDVAVEDTDGPNRKTSLPTPSVPPPFQMARPLPAIGPKQPLPQIGSLPRALPPIGMRSPLPSLTSPASSMPPRKVAPDPFATGLSVSPTTLGNSPARMTPAPLQTVRLPSTGPSPSPTKSPTKVTTVGPLSPPSPSDTTKPPDTSTNGAGEAPVGEES